jgi:3-oxoacyl-[acyl-carrier protein] reductase
MDLKIKGKFALVCASSKGLGFSVAESLLEEGCNVLITSRNDQNLEDAKVKLLSKKYSGAVESFKCDLSKKDDVIKLFKKASSLSENIDILVNNCGGPTPGNFDEIDMNDLEIALNNNLKNTIFLTKMIIPIMKENNWGRIVNITSSSAKQPIDNLILSNITRSGIISFAKTISNEYARFNIMINNIMPGRIITDRIREIANNKNGDLEEILDSMGRDLPIMRLGKPEEFGPIVAFLCSEKASYITGNSIQVDGGLIKSLF